MYRLKGMQPDKTIALINFVCFEPEQLSIRKFSSSHFPDWDFLSRCWGCFWRKPTWHLRSSQTRPTDEACRRPRAARRAVRWPHGRCVQSRHRTRKNKFPQLNVRLSFFNKTSSNITIVSFLIDQLGKLHGFTNQVKKTF